MNLRSARTMFDDLSNAELIRALKSNSDEIARLVEALRKAEAERNEMRNARDRAEKARADDYRQQTETVRALLEQRDDARAEAERLMNICELALVYLGGTLLTSEDGLRDAQKVTP